MNRVTFLVDGFKVYHSLVDAGFQEEKCLKWLDLHSLLLSYPNLIGGNPTLHRLHYFSALANHRLAQDSGVIASSPWIKGFRGHVSDFVFRQGSGFCPYR